MLAAIYVCVGDNQLATETMTDFLGRWPDRTIRSEAARISKEWIDPAIRERWLHSMKTAGMPE